MKGDKTSKVHVPSIMSSAYERQDASLPKYSSHFKARQAKRACCCCICFGSRKVGRSPGLSAVPSSWPDFRVKGLDKSSLLASSRSGDSDHHQHRHTSGHPLNGFLIHRFHHHILSSATGTSHSFIFTPATRSSYSDDHHCERSLHSQNTTPTRALRLHLRSDT
jgi:hypothetical protein